MAFVTLHIPPYNTTITPMSETTTNSPKENMHFRRIVMILPLAVLIVCSGCHNPWMEKILEPFFAKYNIGDTGPGGGRIFYESTTGFTDMYSGQTHHYLEAAPINLGTNLGWASSAWIYNAIPSMDSTNSTDTADTPIGTGRRNTAFILEEDNAAPAALACKNYTGGGKTDWFLPSRDELIELYNQRTILGIPATNAYWSSSQYNDNQAWYMGFDYPASYPIDKDDPYNVRAIRSF